MLSTTLSEIRRYRRRLRSPRGRRRAPNANPCIPSNLIRQWQISPAAHLDAQFDASGRHRGATMPGIASASPRAARGESGVARRNIAIFSINLSPEARLLHRVPARDMRRMNSSPSGSIDTHNRKGGDAQQSMIIIEGKIKRMR